MSNKTTAQATTLFMEKIAALFPVKRVLMFGSRARANGACNKACLEIVDPYCDCEEKRNVVELYN